jgi:hypothetical protein
MEWRFGLEGFLHKVFGVALVKITSRIARGMEKTRENGNTSNSMLNNYFTIKLWGDGLV